MSQDGLGVVQNGVAGDRQSLESAQGLIGALEIERIHEDCQQSCGMLADPISAAESTAADQRKLCQSAQKLGWEHRISLISF